MNVNNSILVVIDMQNDFVSGSLGSADAQAIVPYMVDKVAKWQRLGRTVIYTQDTHTGDYLSTPEGRALPIVHCVDGTHGHAIIDGLDTGGCEVLRKGAFGCVQACARIAEIARAQDADVQLCGVCTDICVLSNAIILQALLPGRISVYARACAGATVAGHDAALLVMAACQIAIVKTTDI
jgi:nicotinamidase-related amidase